MESPTRPATPSATEGRARAIRAAALVGFVWTITALPFVLGRVRCPTAQLFHFPCPGCGMTRALVLLSQGELGASLAMHALAAPTLLAQAAFGFATVIATLRFGAPWHLWRARWGRSTVVLLAVVLAGDVVLWIARALGAFGGPVPV